MSLYVRSISCCDVEKAYPSRIVCVFGIKMFGMIFAILLVSFCQEWKCKVSTIKGGGAVYSY